MRFLLASALIMVASAAQAVVVYDADFSQIVSIDHTTTGNALEPSPQAGANFTIGYTGTPASDTTRNFFETDGDSLISSDFGGDHFFRTDDIDVSGFDTVSIEIVSDFVGTDSFNNSPTEFIRYFYTLDSAAEQQFFFFTDDPNGTDLNATEEGIDVSGVGTLVVGIAANVNGAGDGWDLSRLTVDALSSVPVPASLPMMVLGLALIGALRARRG